MAERINLSKSVLDKASCPAGKSRAYIYDAKAPGLAFMVTAKGAKGFYFYKWDDGAPVRIHLGGYPDLSIDGARDQAATYNGRKAAGVNLRAERQRAKASMTLAELFDHYLNTHAKQHKKTWQHDVETFERYFGKAEADKKPDDKPAPFPGWRTRRVSAITHEDVRALHAKVGANNGPYSANRLLAMLSAMFNNAKLTNPADGVKRFKEEKRARFLHPDELPKFFEALAKCPNPTIRDFILLAILVGARRGNLQAMQWAEVNLERGTWEIPDTKSGEAVTAHLAPAAVKVLTTRFKARDKSPYVFAGRGKTGHLMEPKTAWAAILKAAGLEGLRIHDLRRTLGSWQAAGGASLPIIGKSLGHKDGSPATAIYARMNLDPVKQSVNAATAAMGQFIPAGLIEQAVTK